MGRRRVSIKRLARLITSNVVCLLSLGLAVRADAGCQMTRLADIPVELAQNQLLTRGVIDGQPIHVLVDTGASMSLVWRPSLERLGLRSITGPRLRFYRPIRWRICSLRRTMHWPSVSMSC